VAKLDRVLRRRQHVVVMKLDVEGMEPSVLRGASRLLSRWRPVVFAEADAVEEKDEIAAVLRPYGYTETGRVFNSTPTFEFVAPPRVGKERLRLLTQRVHPFWLRLPKWLRNRVGRKIAARLPETRSWLGGREPQHSPRTQPSGRTESSGEPHGPRESPHLGLAFLPPRPRKAAPRPGAAGARRRGRVSPERDERSD
jgi:Methyltransferase FkbM domain